MHTPSLSEIEAHDSRPVSTGKDEFRFLCGLSADCRHKPGDAQHRSLCVNKRTGAFFCHRCGSKGCLREYWQDQSEKKNRVKFGRRERSRLALETRFASPPEKPKKETQSPEKLEKLQEQMLDWQANFSGSPAERYLISRCVSPAVTAQYGCGYAKRWQHWEKRDEQWILTGVDERVVFPITDKSNALVAVQARAINKQFVGAEKLTKGDKSLGLFQPRDFVRQKAVAVAEGPVDALALATCGITAAAMVGTSFPGWLALALAFKAVLLATDADAAGDQAAAKLIAELIARGARTFRLRPRAAKDWAESLEKIGATRLTEQLSPFARESDDEIIINKSWIWFREGREDAAQFAAKLIADNEAREWLLEKFRRLKSV